MILWNVSVLVQTDTKNVNVIYPSVMNAILNLHCKI